MKVGMNLFLWTDDPADPSWLPLYGRLKDMGFDGIELPIFDPDPEKFATLGRRLDDLGLERTAVTICEPETDPISPDASIRRAATERLNLVVDCCEAAGVQTLAGPIYAAIGQFSGAGATEEEWQRSLG
ncbi:MAG: sugar phosphate isomerase/epimerase family protein, partial [Myxococcota bacterium]